MTHDDEVFMAACAAGCEPYWYDGIFGPAWHCGCVDLKHALDQQCSMVTLESIRQATHT